MASGLERRPSSRPQGQAEGKDTKVKDETVFSYSRALGLEREGRYEEAIEAFRATIRLDPRDVEAHIHLGVVLRHLGRDAEANEAFDAALAICSQGRRA
jgi:Flp pilus assembly protein TadD